MLKRVYIEITNVCNLRCDFCPGTRREARFLSPAELRLLQCLLYGGDTGWVQAEGHLLSVLVDGVNEKLYDTFLDSVLDDAPQVLEDYIDDLKEMIRP